MNNDFLKIINRNIAFYPKLNMFSKKKKDTDYQLIKLLPPYCVFNVNS